MVVKPMRAVKVEDSDLSKIAYPIYAQPKFDGIRCFVQNGIALSNTLKPIRNKTVQEILFPCTHFDGELIAGNFQETASTIMSTDGGNDWTYYVFDIVDPHPVEIYRQRMKALESVFAGASFHPNIQLVPSVTVKNIDQLMEYEEAMLSQGFEGIMLRSPHGKYKLGRSTLREQYLMKRKPFIDEEATIIGFGEQEENLNELTRDERGYAKRSSHVDNKAGKDTLGFFRVQSPRWGEFKIGTGLGLTDQLRQDIWLNQHEYIGKTITFKYQSHGVKDKPRSPIFLRFRPEEDMVKL